MVNIRTEKDLVLRIATRLIIQNMTPSAARIDHISDSSRTTIVKKSVETAMELVALVDSKYPKC